MLSDGPFERGTFANCLHIIERTRHQFQLHDVPSFCIIRVMYDARAKGQRVKMARVCTMIYIIHIYRESVDNT